MCRYSCHATHFSGWNGNNSYRPDNQLALVSGADCVETIKYGLPFRWTLWYHNSEVKCNFVRMWSNSHYCDSDLPLKNQSNMLHCAHRGASTLASTFKVEYGDEEIRLNTGKQDGESRNVRRPRIQGDPFFQVTVFRGGGDLKNLEYIRKTLIKFLTGRSNSNRCNL